MARSRTIRPSFFTSFTLAKVSRDARLFFTGLWIEADDEGRVIDSPKRLSGAIFPHDEDVTPVIVDGWLHELEGIEAIERYEVEGGRYLHIREFVKHQKPPHPTPSQLPPPPSRNIQESPVNPSGGIHALVSVSVSDYVPVSVPPRPSGREEGETGACAPRDEAARRLAKLCRGTNRGRVSLEVAQVMDWCWDVVDKRIIEESMGWFDEHNAPDLPRAVAAVIKQKADDFGVQLAPFQPTRRPA